MCSSDLIAKFMEADLDAKSQWPDPWLSLNPFFADGGSVTDLVDSGLLHPECTQIFQSGKTSGGTVCDGRPIRFYQHQREAIEAAGKGVSYMENVPMWHYRSPNPKEYQQALAELEAQA